MKRLRLIGSVMVVLFAAVTLQACSDDDDEIRMDNQAFVTEASSSNMFEIEAGELAVIRGAHVDVKAFGAMMVAQHGEVGAQMAALVQRKGWSMPDDLLAKHQQRLDQLEDLEGAEFDRRFAEMMVMSHEEAIDLFESASGDNGVTDSDLKRFAGEKVPALKQHLEEAEDMRAEVND